jgi:hypothetical protein
MDFKNFSKLFNEVIFDTSRAILFEKVSKYPDRYVGIFRPTRPKAKLLQNLLQSSEIRFGDAFEKIIEEYFSLNNYEILDKKLSIIEKGKKRYLSIDQFVRKDNQIIFIEQKVRDDHDSSKKRGQVENFEAKLNAIIEKYGDENLTAYFYFIDPSLVKNKNYYEVQLKQLEKDYQIKCSVVYGGELFEELGLSKVWEEILDYLKKWKENIPELPETNFDLDSDNTFDDLKDLPPRVFRSIFRNDEVKEQILPVLFPENKTLIKIKEYFEQKEGQVYKTLSSDIDSYIKNV